MEKDTKKNMDVNPEEEKVDTQEKQENKDEKSNKKKKHKKDSKEEQLEELNSKLAEISDKHLRLQAEFDNFRKRTLKEKADLIKTGGESVLINIQT